MDERGQPAAAVKVFLKCRGDGHFPAFDDPRLRRAACPSIIYTFQVTPPTHTQILGIPGCHIFLGTGRFWKKAGVQSWTLYTQPRTAMDNLLTITDVMNRVNLSRSMIYQLLKHDNFPKPKKIGRSVRWSSKQIDEWIEGRES